MPNKNKSLSQPDYVLRISQEDFDLDVTLCCGQCFRWEKREDVWQGVVGRHQLTLQQKGDQLLFFNTTPKLAEGFWSDYFDLKTDYAAYKTLFSAHPVLKDACAFSPGLHLLRQEPWETLCTFILSQNNNIPRIKGLVQRLCELFGESIEDGLPAFPSPQRLAALSLEDLAPVRAGFRAKYLLDAAQKVASGELPLDRVADMNTEEARNELMKIKGVGPKVADCTLLFGFYKLDAFPQDVWIKRAMAFLFPDGLPKEILPLAGMAQQYIFHYARSHPKLFEETA